MKYNNGNDKNLNPDNRLSERTRLVESEKRIMGGLKKCLSVMIIFMCLMAGLAYAGDLNSPAAPTDPTSAMYILEDLYNRLVSGATGAKRGGSFSEPTSAPGSTMHNLNDIMNKAPVIDPAGAAPGEILSGKKYWGLTSGQWGTQTGTMTNVGAQNVIPGVVTQAISQGYHSGTGSVTGDANLVTGNIKANTTIFGVTGKAEVVDTTTGDAVAGELLSGKKAWVDGTEVTGTLATKVLSPASNTVEAGNYAATILTEVDADLVTGNIKANTTIFGVTGDANVVNTSSGDALSGEVMSGKKAWVGGAEVTGTLATKVLSPASNTVEAGNYAATTLTAVDADLVAGNIKAGTTIFGVTGDNYVVNTSSGNATAGELLFNRTAWVDGVELTGIRCGGTVLKTGGTLSAGGRWYDNADGTIVDTTTGLVWLKNVGWGIQQCFVATFAPDVFSVLDTLSNGVGGLSDGSVAGDWGVPTKRELLGLNEGNEPVSFGSQGPFTGIADDVYWTTTRGTAEAQVFVYLLNNSRY